MDGNTEACRYMPGIASHCYGVLHKDLQMLLRNWGSVSPLLALQ